MVLPPSDSQPTEVVIQVCGRLAVTVGERPCEADLPGRQGRLALAYLALHRSRAVTRARLIEGVWGEDVTSSRSQALNVLLSKLRRALGPGVIETVGDSGLRLAAAARVDVHAAETDLEQALGARQRGEWRTVVATAAQLAELADAGLLPGYEAPWLEEPRRRLEELGLQARELRADAGLSLGGAELAPSERAAREVVEQAPFRESSYLLLMRLAEAQGNVAEALRVYETLRVLLRDELGIAPGPQVQHEFERILHSEDREDAEGRVTRRSQRAPAPAPESFFATRSGAAFVGRRFELERLRHYFERASDGRRQLVLLEGEPGVGKTRLTLELMSHCQAKGGLTLYGRCDAESLVPYQPFVEALRLYLARAPEERLRGWREQHGAELAGVVPELARAGSSAGSGGSEETDRYRLFDAVTTILADIARSQPVALVLDDLHWADKPTLLTLRQLVRSCDDAPLLIIGSYRDTERPPELVDMLVQLRREQFFERIALHGLDEHEAASLIAGVAERPVPDAVRRVLWEETRGNPFFLEEILRHVASGAGDAEDPDWPLEPALPESVREVIERRLSALSEPTRNALTIAAVVGREFSLDVLEAAGVGEEELDEMVSEASAGQVVAEMPGVYGRCSFTHSLIRQTLYEALTATRRARLHLLIAEAIERLWPDPDDAPLAELAHHFSLAPPLRGAAKAVEYAELAAAEAASILAFEEAARLYGIALEALGANELTRKAALLLRLGDAHTKAGDFATARATFDEASRMARALGSPRLLAQAALGFGAAGQMAGGVVDDTVVALLEEALAAVRQDDLRLRARLLARLAIELSFSELRERRAALSSEAVELAGRASDPSALGFALVARHWSLWGPGNVGERLEAANDLLRLAERSGDDRLATLGHRCRMMDLLELGEIEAVDTEIDAHARLAAGRKRPADAMYMEIYRAMRMLLSGEFDGAEAASLEALRIGRRFNDTNADQAHVLQMVALRRERGGLEGIVGAVSDLADRFQTIPGWHCVLASLHAQTGRPDAARRVLDAFGGDGFRGLPLDGIWLGAIATLAETAAEIGDPTHAATLYDLLEPYADRNVAIGWAAACAGSASRHLALLAALMGDRRRATVHFDAALTMNARMGAHALVARTKVELAHLLLQDRSAQERGRILLVDGLEQARELRLPQVIALGEASRDELSGERRFQRVAVRAHR